MPLPASQIVFSVRAPRPGLAEITSDVERHLHELTKAGEGRTASLCNLFIQHTSASLLIQENADPSARRDLETFLERLVPPSQDFFTHTTEGPDDMPSHIKAALTQTFLTIPVHNGRLAMGTWQGIYLWEHRSHPSSRKIVLTVV